MKQTVLGILAHVDAGKTTLSESLLYVSGTLRKQGRVDHQDAFLDYNPQERDRGITIYTKQAIFSYGNTEFNLIDTPGHVDFSTEMERSLSVLDYAIVVISGQDGVQSHTETIWSLLNYYNIPTYIFINKMDISNYSKEELLANLQKGCSDNCIAFDADFYEKAAMTDEELLEEYLENNTISKVSLQKAIKERKLFPVFFGSALKNEGTKELLEVLDWSTMEVDYPEEFGAKVFKITHDDQGTRLTHMKITGGSLSAKDKISEEEKVDQIRRYSGTKYTLVDSVTAGMICTIKGLNQIEAGMGLGYQKNQGNTQLAAFMQYLLVLPKNTDPEKMIPVLRELAEEDPSLKIDTDNRRIHLQIMGEIQKEVLTTRIYERTGVIVGFDQGKVVYKETIKYPSKGVGHFEPLRHYAEVHLALEPLPQGSGLVFASNCSEDILSRNWQRLIMTHLQERKHRGVLTHSEITDMKITLTNGRAHLKHTEGGDFRQATYRAIRQGLKMTESVLLEPYYSFNILIPADALSKVLFQLEQITDQMEVVPVEENMQIIGKAPASKMQDFQRDFPSFCKGRGKLNCTVDGYYPCLDQDEIVASIGYDSERDFYDPTGSVFCAHGAGFYVPYDEVYDYMHIKEDTERTQHVTMQRSISDDEVKRVVGMAGGRNKKEKVMVHDKKKEKPYQGTPVAFKPEILLVDGYNMLFSFQDTKELANQDINTARDVLIRLIGNYQGYRKCKTIIVFDAYKVKQGTGSLSTNGELTIVYTKEAQTADSYIEMATHKLAKEYRITVATSDYAEQRIIFGAGANRMSARELEMDLNMRHSEAMNTQKTAGSIKSPLADLRKKKDDYE